jgi:hypothetical protein
MMARQKMIYANWLGVISSNANGIYPNAINASSVKRYDLKKR